MRSNLFKCRIAINIVPFLLSVIFFRISLSSLKVRFSEGLVQASLQFVGQTSLQMVNLDISLCVWFGGDPCYIRQQKHS
jgi:hypothetical protein